LAVLLPIGTTNWVVARLFGAGGGALRDAALRAFTDPQRRRRIRIDFAGMLALLALGAWCWGAHWPVLLACIAVRFTILSILDNAPHYGTPRDSGTRAFNVTMPRRLRWLVLNANFHGMHHHAPQLSWRELPHAFDRAQPGFDGSWIAMVLRQFRGPVHLS
jgi:fatty acid desaturase